LKDGALSRLIIIDQSLKGIGGHHFDYTLQIAQTAAMQQCEVVVASHRKFTNGSRLDHYARVHPVFRTTTYSKYSLLAGLRSMHSKPPIALRTAGRFGRMGKRHSPHQPTIEQPDLERSESKYTGGGDFVAADRFPLMRSTGRWLGQRIANLKAMAGRLNYGLQYLQESSGRNQAVKAFAGDCQTFFRHVGLNESDHVFFTTINDLELAGLLTYWMSNPESYQPNWHMQFHFDVFAGRPPEYRIQLPNMEPLRDLFEDIEIAVPSYQIHYYATTASIADQYQRLSARPIHELTYPISQAFVKQNCTTVPITQSSKINTYSPQTRSFDTEHRDITNLPTMPTVLEEDSLTIDRLQQKSAQVTASENFLDMNLFDSEHNGVPIVLAGGIRAEKGQNSLQSILPALKTKVLDSELGFLVCQRKEKSRWFCKPFALRLDEKSEAITKQVQYLQHPLDTGTYQNLIRNAGIGLLTYNNRTYANRRAGIFGEYLAAGVPVLVPSGCWMADQLSIINATYHQELLKENQSKACWNHLNFEWSQWNVPSANGCISFDGQEVPAYAWSPELPKQDPENHCSDLLSLRFHWVWPKEAGTYCRVQVIFHQADGTAIEVESSVVGICPADQSNFALFRIPSNARSFRLGFSNAYHDRNASINRLLIDVIRPAASQQLPLGAVGLAYDSLQQIPDKLQEMCQHHDHYQSHSQDNAQRWFQKHDPVATVSQILSAPQSNLAWAG